MGEYLIRGETLQETAEALREKLGSDRPIRASEMPDAIRSIFTLEHSVPLGVKQEAQRLALGFTEKMQGRGITFLAMADMHQYGTGELGDGGLEELYRNSIRYAGMGAALVAEEIQPDFMVNLGDLIGGTSGTTLKNGLDGIVQVRQDLSCLEGKTLQFGTPGNHDALNFSVSLNGEYLSPGVTGALIGDYTYRDFADRKVRVILLSTADNRGRSLSHNSDCERISPQQLQWFAQTLDLSDKPDGDQWKILLFAHHPLDWGPVQAAGNCLAAYLAGETYSVVHEDVEISCNFAGKNVARVVAQFHGHTHCFKVDAIHDRRSGQPVPTGVKRIAIPNASFHRTNELGTMERYGLVYGEGTTYQKDSALPEKSTSFCLVGVDLENGVIYADCFGAGYDRVISWEAP
jgi:hypothetical protein